MSDKWQAGRGKRSRCTRTGGATTHQLTSAGVLDLVILATHELLAHRQDEGGPPQLPNIPEDFGAIGAEFHVVSPDRIILSIGIDEPVVHGA